MPDYIMHWLAWRFLDADTQEELGILTPEVRARKSAQEALMRGDTAGPTNGGGNGPGDGSPDAGGAAPEGIRGESSTAEPTSQAAPKAPGTTRAAAEALTDEPPVLPARLQGPRSRTRVRAVRRDDAAHGLVLHVLELREQHGLRVGGGARGKQRRRLLSPARR